jgi:hypothetical protein
MNIFFSLKILQKNNLILHPLMYYLIIAILILFTHDVGQLVHIHPFFSCAVIEFNEILID